LIGLLNSSGCSQSDRQSSDKIRIAPFAACDDSIRLRIWAPNGAVIWCYCYFDPAVGESNSVSIKFDRTFRSRTLCLVWQRKNIPLRFQIQDSSFYGVIPISLNSNMQLVELYVDGKLAIKFPVPVVTRQIVVENVVSGKKMKIIYANRPIPTA
jgi:hypothetical protein